MAYYTTFNGNTSAGLGSLLQLQLHLYAYARMKGETVFFPGFQKLSHFQYTDTTQTIFCDQLNKYFNIPSVSGIGIRSLDFIQEGFLLKNWAEDFNAQKKEYIQELFHCLQYEGENYFDLSKKTAVIHIRSVNPQDNCDHPNREYYSISKRQYFLNLYQNIKALEQEELDVHVFSQGEVDDFKCFENLCGATLHINDDLITTMNHLITADILITSNSSLSWCAHLYGQNKEVYSRDNFFHSWYPDTNLVNRQGFPIGHR